MDDAVITHLRAIVVKYGPNVCDDPRRLENLLRDVASHHRGEIFVLASAAREGVPTGLLASQGGLPPLVAADRFVRNLQDNLGLAPEGARWAVRAWAMALGVTGLESLSGGSTVASNAWPSVSSRSSGAARSVSQPVAADWVTRMARSTTKAMDIAQAMPEPSERAVALGSVAIALALSDPDQSAAVLEEVDQLAASFANERARMLTLYDLALTLAAADTDRAEFFAQSITRDGVLKDHALSQVARALIGVDPDRALRITWSMSQSGLMSLTRAKLATALAATEPQRAEQLARSLDGDYWKAHALTVVAAALAETDVPQHAKLVVEAEYLAQSLTDGLAKSTALADVAKMYVDADHAAGLFTQAFNLVNSLSTESAKSAALGSIAIAYATKDPGEAISRLREVGENWYAIGEIAKMLSATDPDRALDLALSIKKESPHLVDVAAALADTHPDGALRLTWSMKDEQLKQAALVQVARSIIPDDAERAAKLLADAERSTRLMSSDLGQVLTLTDIACAWAEQRVDRTTLKEP